MNNEQLEAILKNLQDARHDVLVISDALADCSSYLAELSRKVEENRNIVVEEQKYRKQMKEVQSPS